MDTVQTILHNQAVTHERLQLLIGLVIFGVVLGLAVVVMLGFVIHVKVTTRDKLQRELDLLEMVKDWANSARAHSRDATEATKTIAERTPQAAQTVIAEIHKVPEKTVEVLERKLGSGDSHRDNDLPPGKM